MIDLKKKFIKNLIEYRNFFNFILNLKTYKFKSFFKKFNNINYFIKLKSINFFFYDLKHVLINSKIIFNYSDFLYLLKNSFFFKNRQKIYSNELLNKNDLLEILFFKHYFIYIKKINNLNLKKKKFNNKNFSYKNIINLKKSNFLRIFNNSSLFVFNKNIFYEIDLKTLSIFILNINKNISNSSLNNYKIYFINFFLINLYKWKQ